MFTVFIVRSRGIIQDAISNTHQKSILKITDDHEILNFDQKN